MLVLSAVVRVAGLASATSHLLPAREGLLSAAWRAREGAMKLVIAGLLCWKPSSPSSLGFGDSGVSVGRGVAGERLGHGRETFVGGNGGELLIDDDEHQSGGRRPGRGEGLSAGSSNGSDSKRRNSHSPRRSPAMPPRGAHGCGHRGNGGATLMSMAEKEQLVRGVGSLLVDERPEVSVNRYAKGVVQLGRSHES